MYHIHYDAFYSTLEEGSGEKGNNFRTREAGEKALLAYMRASKRSVVHEWDAAIYSQKKVLESLKVTA